MLVGLGWMAQAHMQQMAATGVAPTAPPGAASSTAMVSGAAGGIVRWMGRRLDGMGCSAGDNGANGYGAARRGRARPQSQSRCGLSSMDKVVFEQEK